MTQHSPFKSNGNNDGEGSTGRWQWPGDIALPAGTSTLRRAKLWAIGNARKAGVLSAVRDSRWRSRRLLILAYHGIALRDEHEWSPELYLHPDALRARFEIIRAQGYRVLPLAEGVERLRNGTLPPRALSITFDDGMCDFLDRGVPLLREFGFPATVYITTYYAEKQVPVFRIACRYFLWRGRNRTIDGKDLTVEGGPLRLTTLDERDAVLTAIEQRVTNIDGGVAEEVATLRRLAERVGDDYDQFVAERLLRVMSPDEIRSLPSDLIDVQLHTHRHRVPLKKESFEREIIDNRWALEQWRPGSRFDAFCYPSGVTDERFLPWLREHAITTGVTCDVGLATVTSDPLMLPRYVDTSARTRDEFEAWLSGFASLLPRLPDARRYKPAPVFD